jgi:hypothetical protein
VKQIVGKEQAFGSKRCEERKGDSSYFRNSEYDMAFG